MNSSVINVAEELLKEAGFNPGPADGVITSETADALKKALQASTLPKNWASWTPSRMAIAWIQASCQSKKINAGPIDGLWGPVTENAFDSLVYLRRNGKLPEPWRDERPTNTTWPLERESELTAFYGKPGAVKLAKVTLPYSMKIAWEPSQVVKTLSCHEKVADSLVRVLTGVLQHYGESEIRRLRLDMFGGCYNPRPKRGGTGWSTHAWGIALDFDPDNNSLHWGRDRATFARPEYNAWWKAWEDEGWTSLGRARNFDWMHVQAARVS